MNKKRAFALLMGILMIVTSLPLVALPTFAAGNVCKIEGATDTTLNQEYDTFDNAMKAVYASAAGTDGAPADCGTLTLLTNGAMDQGYNTAYVARILFGCLRAGSSGSYTVGDSTYKTLTIDLNGKTISGTGNNSSRAMIYVAAGSELTITDSSTGGAISGYATTTKGGLFNVAGTLNIEGGTFTDNAAAAEGGSVAYLNGASAVVNVSGGTFVCGTNKAFSNGGATLANSSITGGTFDTNTLTADGALETEMAAQGYELVQEGTNYVVSAASAFVCKIEGAADATLNKEYETFGAAITAIYDSAAGTDGAPADCGTLTLLKNGDMNDCKNTANVARILFGCLRAGTSGSYTVGDSTYKTLTIDLNGKTLTKSSDNTGRAMMYVAAGSELTVTDSSTGGAISGYLANTKGGLFNVAGTLNIEGGTFTDNGAAADGASVAYLNGAGAVLNVSGGTFVCGTNKAFSNGGATLANSSITGGSFDTSTLSANGKFEDAMAAQGYELVLSGTKYVVAAIPENVCKIEGATDATLNKEYDTFDNAMMAIYNSAAGTDGAPADCGTLTLLKDGAMDQCKNLGNYGRLLFGCIREEDPDNSSSSRWYGGPAYKKLTIDLNGQTLTSTGNNSGRGMIYIDAGSELTIKDSSTGGGVTGYATTAKGGLFNVAGTLNIEGGTFTDNGTAADGASVAYLNGASAVLNVSGGTFVCGTNKAFSYKDATLANSGITGGSFDTNTLTADGALEAAMAAKGYKLLQDGAKYSVELVVVMKGAQMSTDATIAPSGKYALRLVAEVKEEMLADTKAGFNVALGSGTAVPVNSKYYYRSLLAQGPEGLDAITPTEGYVLIAVIITDIPDSYTEFTVTPEIEGVATGASATVRNNGGELAVNWVN